MKTCLNKNGFVEVTLQRRRTLVYFWKGKTYITSTKLNLAHLWVTWPEFRSSRLLFVSTVFIRVRFKQKCYDKQLEAEFRWNYVRIKHWRLWKTMQAAPGTRTGGIDAFTLATDHKARSRCF